MSTQRVEIQHNEPEQIRGWMIEAVKLVDNGVREELRSPELLVKVIELLASKTIQEVRFVPPDLIAAPAGSIPRGNPGH